MPKQRAGIYRRYIPGTSPAPEPGLEAYWFIFRSGQLLVRELPVRTASPDPAACHVRDTEAALLLPGEPATDSRSAGNSQPLSSPPPGGELPAALLVPLSSTPEALGVVPLRRLYLGTLEGIPCYAAEAAGTETPEGLLYHPLRLLYDYMEEDVFHLAGRALQLLAWEDTHQYCGRCGAATNLSPPDHCRVCPECGLAAYPRLAPAVITAILKDGRLLLARGRHFQDNLYGLIAGFVEPGETLEDCVRRETKEEVGISVSNITYFGSQQWPFPHSLMIGFMAEYESGEITVDEDEIVHADWFDLDDLPRIPPPVSIARKMIDLLVEERQQQGVRRGHSPDS